MSCFNILNVEWLTGAWRLAGETLQQTTHTKMQKGVTRKQPAWAKSQSHMSFHVKEKLRYRMYFWPGSL